MFQARLVQFIATTDPRFREAAQLRYTVLFEPHGVIPELDMDDNGFGVLHAIVTDAGRVIGYGRLQRRGTEAQIRHLCVDPTVQGGGIGSMLVKALIERARKDGAKLVFLNARFTAMGLYRRFGFVETGPIFNAENTQFPHKRMELKL
jgi:ribosomal protein S18 acetylase RimI-like enzyme